MGDRVGLGWRGEIAASILENLDEIDVLEVIAEDWMSAPRPEQRALRDLGRERPILLHGVAMGLASSHPVEARRLDRMARLVETARPECWSEHLAFVRGGGHEIGHLAAPPRNGATIEGALDNIRVAERVVGIAPALENVATLIDPPLSTMGEGEWTAAIVRESRAPLLLDLHNLYANAVNFGQKPAALMAAMPLEQVRIAHLSGGRWLHPAGAPPRLLDDHVHDIPDPVFALLEQLACAVSQPLTVVLERDGRFPDFERIIGQLRTARGALATGRNRALVDARQAA